MKLNMLHRKPKMLRLFHGVSGDSQEDVVGRTKYLAFNGFDERGAYFTQSIGIALSYNRMKDFSNLKMLNGVIETIINDLQQCSIDGDAISTHLAYTPNHKDVTWREYFDEHWPNTNDELRMKFALLSFLHTQWAENDEDPMGDEKYIEIFGDINPYDAAQKVADELTKYSGCIIGDQDTSRGNVKINRRIHPNEIIGAYLFDCDDNWMCVCVKVIKGHNIKVGDKFKMVGRTVS